MTPDRLDHPYLRLADLRRLRRLVFASRRPVEGLYAGRHVSPQRGHSVEFTDYRAYMPGDEIGDIDWKVFGRTDKLFVKIFEHQSDMTVHLLVDASASMSYGKEVARGERRGARKSATAAPHPSPLAPHHSKYDHAARMAAAVAFLVIQQQDRVSFGRCQSGLEQFIAPARTITHLTQVLAAMEQPPAPGSKANLAASLQTLAGRVGRRGLLVIFSDLHEDPEPILSALAQFTHRGTEAIVFQVLHPDEIELPAATDALFVDSETGEKIAANLDDLRDDYQQKMRAHLDHWATSLRARGIDHNLVTTAHDYTHSLQRYLFQRAASA